MFTQKSKKHIKKRVEKREKKSKKVRFSTNNTSIQLFDKNNIVTPNYKPILGLEIEQLNVFNHRKNIVFLQKLEFDVWYNTKIKYPLLVAQPIDEKTFKQNNEVRRDLIVDSFAPDINRNITRRQTFTEEDYYIYMEYGGSMGHNAPASYHKTNLDTYKETFLLSNVCPQEIVMNAGIWVLLETWCKDFYSHGQSKIKNMIIFTGSIKSKSTKILKSYMKDGKSVKMNIPTHMYKIIMYMTKEGKFTCFAYLFKNEPYYMRNDTKFYDMSNNLISLDRLSKMAELNLNQILNYYSQKCGLVKGLDSNNIPNKHEIFKFIKKKKFRFYINKYFTTQMGRSEYYGRLINSKTMEELERHWKVVNRRAEEFKNIDFHREYYNMARKRLNNY